MDHSLLNTYIIIFIKIFNTNFKPDSTKILNVKAFDTLKGINKSLKITENFISFKEKFPDKSKEECFAELGFKDNFWNNYLYNFDPFVFESYYL
jgi:myosin-crossreactive antigen